MKLVIQLDDVPKRMLKEATASSQFYRISELTVRIVLRRCPLVSFPSDGIKAAQVRMFGGQNASLRHVPLMAEFKQPRWVFTEYK